MSILNSRREFLTNVGRGAVAAAVGLGTSEAMGLAPNAEDGPEILHFGEIEPLVCLLQETPAEKLLPALVEQLKSGTDLRRT